MAQTIKLKRSSVSGNTPSTSDLALGEVAINTYDGKMFIKKNDGSDSIVEIGGSSGTVTDAFKTISVSGQTDVVADSATDTLTFVAGANMSITTSASGDSITFASTGSSGSATFLGLSDTPSNFTGAAGKYLKVNSAGNSVEFDTLNFDDLGTTPTTLAGYGITDSLQLGTTSTTALAGNTSIPSALTDLSISDGSSGQVLQTDGSGNFSFVNQTGGNSFGTISVSGQSDVVADQGSDTLTLVAGSNVTLTTNASGDSVTIASTASGTGSTLSSSFTLYEYTATANQTTFSGSDSNSNTLAYDTGTPPKILVYLNGVLLDYTTDYTATNGTSVVLTTGATAGFILSIAAYKSDASFSGDFSLNDGVKLNLGNNDDLQIFHNGTNSVINQTGTGDLLVQKDETTVAEFTVDGIVVTGDVEANEFIGDVRGAVLFKAQAGEALAKGDVVYISGISGNTTIVSKADADDASKMPAFGLVAAAASSGNPVDIYTNGILSGIDTSAYSEGDELFVSTTAGALTATAPTGEASALQKIGKVTRSASSGSIFIVGAGRSNAVPNLDDGDIFLGNSSNQAVSASLNTKIEEYLDSGVSTASFSSITATTYSNLPTIFTVIGRSANTNISLSNGSFTVAGRAQNTTIGVV